MKLTSLITALAITLTGQASAGTLEEWFAKQSEKRGDIPKVDLSFDNPESIAKSKQQVWEAYRKGAIKNGLDKLIPKKAMTIEDWVVDKKFQPRSLKIGDKTMPYVVLTKGEKPATGWPVYFCLHGGGGNPNAKGPHSWDVNTREWFAQMQLTTKVWESPGIYIIPRMADDRQGRWYYSWNQQFIDIMTQQAILFNEADPNRIYLEGISEGGYAAYRLGSMMADRWAGSCSLAAAEPLGTSPPENLRHVAFRCGIGEKDTMFDRVGLARTYFKTLAELAAKHDGQYIHFHDEQKGRGHGIDYKEGPQWISSYKRNPIPSAITWTVIKQHDRHRQRSYWLALDDKLDKFPLYLTADSNRKTNIINITAHQMKDGKKVPATGLNMRVYLSDKLVNLAEPVTINVNGKNVFKDIAKPSAEALIKSIAERGDPNQVFTTQVKLKL